ncbi:methyl-accepting chemotaxis protein [Clostridium neuense]|uniref:Methyl-accepting chemotaxis protein n=1 Tax=Clostridium neuense TaxID=1728934 RepID=A0ABW8TCF7_9CLOT
MNTGKTFKTNFYEKMLKVILAIFIICCIVAFTFYSALKLFGFNDKIHTNSLIILGILTVTYVVILWSCYKHTVSKNGFNVKWFNITKYVYLFITYFQYLYLNFTMHLNSTWLIIFFFITLESLFFDLKLIITAIAVSIACQISVYIYNPSILNYKTLLPAELMLTSVTIIIALILTSLVVYFSSNLLDSISEKEIKINEENQKLLNLFKNISQTSNTVLASSENLSAAIEEQTSTLLEVSETSQNISNSCEEMLNKSNKNSEILKTLLNANETVSKKTNASESQIKDFITVTDKNQQSLNNALTIITDINKNIKNTFQTTKALEEKSKQVDTILNLLGDIAEQTNLLALNASIEAARAGEYGKGFAVVADEIRKLAENTRQSLNQVSSMLDELKANINLVEKQMTENNEKSQTGNNIINETVNDIKIMTDKLKLFSSNIIEINTASTTLLTETQNVVEFNKQVNSLTEDTISKYTTVSQSISQSAATNEEIEANINELKNIAENMNELVK